MKAVATCVICFEELISSDSQPGLNPLSGELDDCGYIHVNCDKGHYSIVIYDARRYEVLIKSATSAFVDGYTNEVIAVMAAALERVYEFYIRVSCRAKGLSRETIDAAWKGIASQSERQFGAFQFLYLIDHDQPFKLERSISNIRNNIIHKGRIARESEAIDFAESVFRYIQSIENSIQSKFSESAHEESIHEIETQKSLVPDGVKYLTLKTSTVVVDNTKHEVIREADSFLDMVGAVVHNRSRGFPS